MQLFLNFVHFGTIFKDNYLFCTMNLSENIQHIRQAKGLSQIEVAALLGMSKSNYSRFEKKGNKIDFEDILKIARVFDISINELIYAQKDEKMLEIESKLEELEEKLQKNEKEKNLIIANCLDFINSAIEQRFCSIYQQNKGTKKFFDDLSSAELKEIYESALYNDYLVHFGIKRGFVDNPILQKFAEEK